MLPLLNEAILLLVDTGYSWIRMLIALAISILLSLAIGIALARSKTLEKIFIPVIDVLQTLPIVAFFPFMVLVVVTFLPNIIGINAAVIFLIVTSMLWNMIFGVYEAIKTIPNEFLELTNLYKLGLYQKLKKLFIPASLPRLSEQMSLSWAIGLFYLVTSEIFSTGLKQYSVQGIGVDLAQLGFSGNIPYYMLGIVIFVGFVVLTRLTLFAYFNKIASRFSADTFERKKRHAEFGLGNPFYKSRLLSFIEEFYAEKRQRFIALIAGEKKALATLVLAVSIVLTVLVVVYYILPSFAMEQLLQTPAYEVSVLVSLSASFLRVWGAFALILVVAIPIAVYTAFISKHRQAYMLVFQVIASVPATILLPLIVSTFSNNGEAVAFVVFFLSGLWYVIFSILASTNYLPSEIIEVKRIFRLNGLVAWKKIYLRAIAPGLITGAITAIAAEWNASIIAEQFSSSGISGTAATSVSVGIGKFLDTSLASGNLYLMLIALINMTAMIILFNTFVWKRLYRRITSIYT